MMFLLNSSSHTSLSSSAPITWSSRTLQLFWQSLSSKDLCKVSLWNSQHTKHWTRENVIQSFKGAVLTFWNVRGSYFQRRQRFFLTKLQTAEIWQQNLNMNEETRFLSPPEVISSDIVATMKLLKLEKLDSLFNSSDWLLHIIIAKYLDGFPQIFNLLVKLALCVIIGKNLAK